MGVLRELEEAGLAVDRVVGASVGAIIAAVHASGRDGSALEEAYAEFVRRRPFSDWTLPSQSLARGRRVRTGLARVFGADALVEGMPRQLRTVSTDLVSRTRQVHRRGSLELAVAASCRLPVLFPPIASDDGRLLVDGGVLDNLPVDLLTERDEGPVVAVNIGAGGGGLPRVGRPRVPPLGDTLMRTMMIGSGGAVAAAQAHGAWVVSPTRRGWVSSSSTSWTPWCSPGAPQHGRCWPRPGTTCWPDPDRGARTPRRGAARRYHHGTVRAVRCEGLRGVES